MRKLFISLAILASAVILSWLRVESIPDAKLKIDLEEIVVEQSIIKNNSLGIGVSSKEFVQQVVLPEEKEILRNTDNYRLQTNDINTCAAECLEKLAQEFFNNIQNKEVRRDVLKKISQIKTSESFVLLFEIIVMANDMNDNELLSDINAQIRLYKSKEVVITLIESLLKNKDSSYAYSYFPLSAKKAITDVINNINQREDIIPVLEYAYFNDMNLIENFLSDLDYPEVYSTIALKAEYIGDFSLKNASIERIINNPSKYTVSAIYLYAEKNQSATAIEDAYYLAKEWGSRYSNPKTLDIAEAKLHDSQSSTVTRIASIGILSNIDDKRKLSSILTKVREHSEDLFVDTYIDETLLNLAELELAETIGDENFK